MDDSYTMTATINDPVALVSDMACSLERVTALIANSNNDYMQHIVDRLDSDSTLHRLAFNIWCINKVAIEKLEEVHNLLGEAERPLMALYKDRSSTVSAGLAAALSDANLAHAASAAAVGNNSLPDAASTADYSVAGHPVGNVADLHAKLAFMVEHQMGDGMDWLPTLLADAAHLAGREG